MGNRRMPRKRRRRRQRRLSRRRKRDCRLGHCAAAAGRRTRSDSIYSSRCALLPPSVLSLPLSLSFSHSPLSLSLSHSPLSLSLSLTLLSPLFLSLSLPSLSLSPLPQSTIIAQVYLQGARDRDMEAREDNHRGAGSRE